jgi:hypothetical protein
MVYKIHLRFPHQRMPEIKSKKKNKFLLFWPAFYNNAKGLVEELEKGKEIKS